MTAVTAPCHTVSYGRQVIAFDVQYRARNTLAIHVHPDGRVEVIAPLDTPLDAIKAKVVRRGSWICKQQRHFAQLPVQLPERCYRSGEGYRYLGRQYRLKVETAGESRVKLHHGRLTVMLPDPHDIARLQALIERWYRQRAEVIFAERLAVCLPVVNRFGVPSPEGWRLVRMTKRWGSCSRAGQILLNPELVMAPKDCIDYVVTHELCHLKEHHHGAAYYRLLDRVMPSWQERKRRLDQTVEVRNL
jgi:predicted metal-dependent hydrolase